MAYSRESFIEDMIRELSLQRKETSTMNEKEENKRILGKMFYDFPEMSGKDIEILNNYLKQVVSDHTYVHSIHLHPNFLENIRYLSYQMSSRPKEKGSEGIDPMTSENTLNIASIAATIYLKLPILILGLEMHELTQIFSGMDEKRNGFQQWKDQFSRLHWYFSQASSSLFSHISQKCIIDGGHLSSLCQFIACLQPLSAVYSTVLNHLQLPSAVKTADDIVASLTSTMNRSAASKTTLSLFLQALLDAVKERALHIPIQTQPVTYNTDSDKDTSSSSNKNTLVVEVLQMVHVMWVHAVLLFRDLLVYRPELISAFLPLLCNQLLAASANDRAVTFHVNISTAASTTECMFVMVLAHVSDYLYSLHVSPSVTSPAISTYSVPNIAVVLATFLNRTPINTSENLTRKENNLSSLQSYVDICDRLSSSDLTNKESVGYLCDLAQLLGIALLNRPGKYSSYLLESQLLPRLLQAYIILLTSSTSNSDLLHRLHRVLSAFVWSEKSLAEYTLRFPRLLSSLLSLPCHYLLLSALIPVPISLSTDITAIDQTSVSPVLSVPLLFGFLRHLDSSKGLQGYLPLLMQMLGDTSHLLSSIRSSSSEQERILRQIILGLLQSSLQWSVKCCENLKRIVEDNAMEEKERATVVVTSVRNDHEKDSDEEHENIEEGSNGQLDKATRLKIKRREECLQGGDKRQNQESSASRIIIKDLNEMLQLLLSNTDTVVYLGRSDGENSTISLFQLFAKNMTTLVTQLQDLLMKDRTGSYGLFAISIQYLPLLKKMIKSLQSAIEGNRSDKTD